MKHIFNLAHIKSVKAWALLYKGEYAGRILANYSDNPAGSVCTVAVHIWDHYEKKVGLEPKSNKETDPVTKWPSPQGTAGGYGYDKFSSAFDDAVRRYYSNPIEEVSGVGKGAVKRWLESFGFTVIEVL